MRALDNTYFSQTFFGGKKSFQYIYIFESLSRFHAFTYSIRKKTLILFQYCPWKNTKLPI